ncbi:MAG: hypothetical protein FRX49_06064 [Trebouxia sp. A1-2]|nr:MAG: hypothetical protein FRX49_06064 [Trebouxia sp. A1-2]
MLKQLLNGIKAAITQQRQKSCSAAAWLGVEHLAERPICSQRPPVFLLMTAHPPGNLPQS